MKQTIGESTRKSLLATAADRRQLRRSLLAWYDHNGRELPWRNRSAPQAAYKVLLSEILLQQTRASVVAVRYGDFLRRFPSLKALAESDLDQVLAAWAGLGYYARGRNLHRAAGYVREHYGGRFPRTPEALETLPGVGRYTAAAIAAIAFEQPVLPLDGNILRVSARLFACPRESPLLVEQAESLAASRSGQNSAHPTTRNGDFAQAMMDLGALICLPAKPRCEVCPVRRFCAAGRVGKGADYGAKAKAGLRPLRRGVAVVVRSGNSVLLVRRPAQGLLGAMRLPPITGLETGQVMGRGKTSSRTTSHPIRKGAGTGARGDAHDDARVWVERAKKYGRNCGTVRHTFTHFTLILQVFELSLAAHPKAVQKKAVQKEANNWIAQTRLAEIALPSLGWKILACADGASAKSAKTQSTKTQSAKTKSTKAKSPKAKSTKGKAQGKNLKGKSAKRKSVKTKAASVKSTKSKHTKAKGKKPKAKK